MSFLIARILGVHALGEYSAVVNTASSAIQPFVQVTTNNSTLLAHGASSSGDVTVQQTAFAGLQLTGLLSAISVLSYWTLTHLAFHSAIVATAGASTASIAAVCFVIGQLFGAVLLGAHYGADHFVSSAKVSIGTSLLVVALAVPTVLFWGLSGAYMMLVLSSTVLPLGLAYSIFRSSSVTYSKPVFSGEARRNAMNQFFVSVPTIARAGVGAVSFWFCTVYVVQRYFGVEGVGLIAVATQWLTFIMLAVSSWGGVTLRDLAGSIKTGDSAIVRSAMFHLLKKNLSVTMVCSMAIALAASWIAKAYGLSHSDIAFLIRLNCAGAILATCNGVFEQLLFCLNRQRAWFFFSLTGFVVQISVTIAFIQKGLFVVPSASICGALVLLCLCAANHRRFASEIWADRLISDLRLL